MIIFTYDFETLRYYNPHFLTDFETFWSPTHVESVVCLTRNNI